MGKTLLIVFVLLLAAVPAMGQGGYIAVYSTTIAPFSCNLPDSSAGLCSYYVFHHLPVDGVTGSQFMVNDTHAGIWLSDTAVFPVTLGNSRLGVSVAYGPCTTAPNPLHILTINYLCQTLTAPCGTLEILGHPTLDPPGLLSVDCSSGFVQTLGWTSAINPNSGCLCNIVATEETNWGQIKSLYE